MEGEGSLWMFILFKGFLGFVVPIGFGVQQLVSIKRQIRADRQAAATAASAEAEPATPAHTDKQRELEPA
jgi:hypothetical protein